MVIAVAVRKRRQIHALAKASLWRHRLLGRVLDRMGQIPIDRGHGDTNAMTLAVGQLALSSRIMAEIRTAAPVAPPDRPGKAEAGVGAV